MKEKYKALLGLGGTIFLFSFLVIIARFETAETPQMFLLFLRMVVASICFLPFFIVRKVWRKPRFNQLIAVSLLSTINVVFFMWGIKYTTASASQLIYAAQPILTIIITSVFYKKKYSRQTVTGVFIGLLGIIFIIYQSAVEKGETISGGLIGNLAMIVAMFGWLHYIIFSKDFSKDYSPVEIGSTSVLVSLIISGILFFIQNGLAPVSITLSPNIILAGIYLGFCGTFLAYLLMQYAIKYLSTLTVNLTSYVQPVVTAILAIFLLGEKLTLSFFLGSMLVFFGVFLTATLEFYHRRKV